MKKNAVLYRAIPVALMMIEMLFFTGAQAITSKKQQSQGTLSDKQQTNFGPISDTKITLEISVGGNAPVKVVQFEGGLIRIEKQDSSVYGFIPYITDCKTGAVVVRAFNIKPISSKEGKIIGESLNEVGQIEGSSLGLEALKVFDDNDARFTIRVKEIHKGETSGYGCCVKCGGVKCSVEAGCGNCCSTKCCGANLQ